MAQFDSAPEFFDVGQATCWQVLAYDVLPAIDIPCRIQVKNARIKALRIRLTPLRLDANGYLILAQMRLHRLVSLGRFGPKIWMYCISTGAGGSQLQICADTDAAFENKFVNSFLRAEYFLFERWVNSGGAEGETYRDLLQAEHGPKVFFGDTHVYGFEQLTHDTLKEGFHTRGLEYLSDHVADALRVKLVEKGYVSRVPEP